MAEPSHGRSRAPVAEDMMRGRWLLAIAELGARVAAEDAAKAFAERTGCSVAEGRLLVRRAWQMLGIADRGG